MNLDRVFQAAAVFAAIGTAATFVAQNTTDRGILQLTYVQLTVVEAGIVWMLWTVRRWITKFGPYLEGFVEVLGEKGKE